MTMLIDPPSPFATLAEWEAFAQEMRALDAPEAREALAEAEKVIAEKKRGA